MSSVEAVTPPSPPALAVPAASSVQAATPPTPPTPGSSVAATANSTTPPTPPIGPTQLAAADLLTPPGVARTVQGGVTSVAGLIPPPSAAPSGAAASTAAAVTPVLDPVTGPLATGVSNLIAPPPLNCRRFLGSVYRCQARCRFHPTCSVSVRISLQHNRNSATVPAVNADIPRALITGRNPAAEQWDR